MISAGRPCSASKRENASNGEDVKTPPKAQITASNMAFPARNWRKAANMPAGVAPVLAMAADRSVDVRVLRVSAPSAGCDCGCRGAVFDAELGVDLLEVFVHGPRAEP